MRNVPKHIDEAFYSGTRSQEVPLVINDPVEVTDGPHVGRDGAVISIEAFDPVVTLVVELGDTGEDVIVPIEALRRYDSTG